MIELPPDLPSTVPELRVLLHEALKAAHDRDTRLMELAAECWQYQTERDQARKELRALQENNRALAASLLMSNESDNEARQLLAAARERIRQMETLPAPAKGQLSLLTPKNPTSKKGT